MPESEQDNERPFIDDPDEEHGESLYRVLAESSPDSIKVLDLDGRLLSMNSSGQHLMEIADLQKWIGKPWIDLWAGEHREKVRRALNEARSGSSGRFEGYRPTTKGRPKWWDVVVTPVLDEDGEPHRLLAIARDITDRKRAEDAVRYVAEASFVVTESLDYEETVSNVVNVLVPGLADWCVVDIEQEDGSLEMAAICHSDPEKIEAAKEMRRRYPPREDAPVGPHSVLRSGEPSMVSTISDELLRTTVQDEEHYRMITSLGLHSYASVPLKARGRTMGAMSIVSAESGRTYDEGDLPLLLELGRICGLAVDNARLYKASRSELRERRKAERKLRDLNETLESRVAEKTEDLRKVNESLTMEVRERRRAERGLEDANRQLTLRNRELQEFAYAASHDLQEPLRKIRSFANLMQSDLEAQLPQVGREYLDRIDHAAVRMTQLIRDLLEYSRVQTRQREQESVDLNRVLEEVLLDLEVPVRESGAEIEADAMPTIEADASQMRQLFQNLISNALKFRRPDVTPHIRITAERIGSADDETWSISVADNGIGFETENLDRIFTPFQRLHSRAKYAGTGIGLAICRRIVERHDGSIRAERNSEQGATFTFTLPSHQYRQEAYAGS